MAALEYLTNNSLIAYPFKSLNGTYLPGAHDIREDWFYDILFVSFSASIRSVYVSSIEKTLNELKISFNNAETSLPIAEVTFPIAQIVDHRALTSAGFLSDTDNLTYAVKIAIGPGLVEYPVFLRTYTREEAELVNSAVILSSPRVARIDFKKYVGSESNNSLEPVASIPQDADKIKLRHNLTYQQQSANVGAIAVQAGAGAGLYDDCNALDPNVYSINSIGPTPSGALFINPSACYSSELLTIQLKDSLPLPLIQDYLLFKAYTGNSTQNIRDTVIPDHSIVFQNFCTPKCSPETMSAFAHYLNRVTDGAAELDKIATRKKETRGLGSRSSDTLFSVTSGDFCINDTQNPFTRCSSSSLPNDPGTIECSTEFVKYFHEGRTLEVRYSATNIQSHTIVEVLNTNSVRVATDTPLGAFTSPKLFFRVVDNGVISNMNCAANAYNAQASALVTPYFQVRYATNESFNSANEYGTLLAVVVAIFNPSPDSATINVSFAPTKLTKQGDIKIRKAGDISTVVVPTTTLSCREYAFVEAVYFIKCAELGGALDIDVNDMTTGTPVLIGEHRIAPVNGAECLGTISGATNSYLVTQSTGTQGNEFEKIEPWPANTASVSALLGVTPPSWLVYTPSYTVPADNSKAVRFTVNPTSLQQSNTSALYTMYYRISALDGAKAISQTIIEYVAKPVILFPLSVNFTLAAPLLVSLNSLYSDSSPLLTASATNMIKLSPLTDSLSFTYGATTLSGDSLSTIGLAISALSGKITGQFSGLAKGATTGLSIFATNPAGVSAVEEVNIAVVSDDPPVLTLTGGPMAQYRVDNVTTYTEAAPLYTFTVTNPPINQYDLRNIAPPGLIEGLVFNPATGNITGKITSSTQRNIRSVMLYAINNYGEGMAEFDITYDTVYDPPTLETRDRNNSPADATVLHISYDGAIFSVVATGDPMADPITFSATNLPPGFTVDSNNGTIAGVLNSSEYPANHASVNYTFSYTSQLFATNRAGTTSKTLKVTFYTLNTTSVENPPSGALTVTKGLAYTSTFPLYKFYLTGPAPSSPYVTTSMPAGLTISSATSNMIVGTVPVTTSARTHTVQTQFGTLGGPTATYTIIVPFNFTSPTTSVSYDVVLNTPYTDITSTIAFTTCGIFGTPLTVPFTVPSGALPPGMSITQNTVAADTPKTEKLIGTPSKLGAYSFKLRAFAIGLTAISPTIIVNVVEATYSISGRVMSNATPSVAVVGVTITVGNNTATTQADGTYTVTNLSPGDYNIAATKPNTFFDVPIRAVRIQSANVTGIDFTSLEARRQITGKVSLGGSGVVGITVGDGTRTVNTDSFGNFEIYSATTALQIAPVSATYIFNPVNYSLIAGTTPVTGQNFTATLIGILPAPSNFTITPSNASLSLAFSALTTNHTNTQTYQYYWSTANNTVNSGWLPLTTTATAAGANTNLTGTITGLTNGTGYSVQVRAVSSANGQGYASVVAYAVPVSAASAPVVYYKPGNALFTLTIVAPVSTGGGAITAYEYSTNNLNWLVIPGSRIITTQTSTGTPGFVNGTAYTVYVRAITTSGASQIVGASTAGTTVTPTKQSSAPVIPSS